MTELDESVLEQRAHDIAVALLPDLIKDEEYPIPLWVGDNFNSSEITDLYCNVYVDLLKDLREWFEPFEYDHSHP